MDGRPNAGWTFTFEGAIAMADSRTCIGSAKFGIERHEAPIDEFPVQPSQKDGLGRMCKLHWNVYTRALRNASAEPGAAPEAAVEITLARAAAKTTRAARGAPKPEPIKTRPARKAKVEGAAD